MSDLLQLSPEFQLSWGGWALAYLGVFILGLSKSGLKGIGVLFVIVFAHIFGGKSSTGVVLPLLIAGDIFAVSYYNRHTEWKYIKRLMPWMIAGVLIGVWVGKDMPETIFKQGMAVIILLTVFMMFWWEYREEKVVPNHWWFAGLMGLSAGFTTMVGNLAGAFANIFFLAMRIPKNVFIGTAAWLFFLINLFKLPFHIFVWETISLDTFALNVRLLPGLALGLFLGVRLIAKIKEHHYRKIILILTALGAILIFFG